MKKIISFNRAIQLILILFGLLVLFHLSIIIGIVVFDYAPLEFLWGGRMETKQELLGFEIISFLIISICFLLVLIISKKIKAPRLMGAARIGFWVLFFLFLLNTVGNILAKSTFEKYFALLTGMLAFLSLRIAIEKGNKQVTPK